MRSLRFPAPYRQGESGYTLIEMLIAISVGSVVILAAFSLLQFTTNDVSRITARARVDQRGRLALEQIMLELHSACVAPNVTPIRAGSSATELRFISEINPLNKEKEPIPTSELATVRARRIVYTPQVGKTLGTLVEESWLSTGKYKFNEAEKPATKVTLLTGVEKTGSTPIFQYYRYYREKDLSPVYGKLNPTALPTITAAEAPYVTKVAVSFTAVPEAREATTSTNDRPVALEDSAVFRLAGASEAASEANLPCTTET